MSTLRVQRIEARAFKAFKHLDFKLDGRHLLAYGGNGAGKSSLYWTLYTFLQSAAKTTPDVAKYFEVDGTQNLLNVHATALEQADAAVVVTLKDADKSYDSVYLLTHELHDTKGDPAVVKANLASDFITYRVLSSFYQFRNSQAIDLWPVFEQEILPFAQGTSTKDIAALWGKLKIDPFVASKVSNETNWYRAQRYGRFDNDIKRFNQAISEAMASVSAEAQRFYDEHFAEPGQEVELKVGVTAGASKYDRYGHGFSVPSIGFEVKLNDVPVRKPQSFLNEAKLTQLALSVRFGATLAHLHDSPMKLLVLDDLLISLDMNNRMKVVDIILSDTFADHQKIILTHDLGFFKEFRRRIGSAHTDWSFQRFVGNSESNIQLHEEKTPIQKAEDYLKGHNLDEAAICLRKAAEETARRYREWADGTALPPGQFFSLTDNLRTARTRLHQDVPVKLYEQVLRCTPIAHRSLLLQVDDSDLDGNASLTPKDRGILKKQRKRLRDLVTDEDWKKMETIEVVDRVLAMTDRVLNPAAHGSTMPLYQEEVRKALRLIQRLEQCLS